MEQNETNQLNKFRFGSNSKNQSTHQSSRTQTVDLTTSQKNSSSPSSTEGSLNIDTTANDDTYPPESYFSSAASSTVLDNGHFSNDNTRAIHSSPAESSLIFERSVEDPTILSSNKCPRCERSQSISSFGDPKFKQCHHQSITNLPSHFSLENYVSPCLDASTELLTDKNTNLDNVEMVYSRRPSTVLLSAALGRSKSDLASMNGCIPVYRSQSLANIKEPSSPIASNSGDVKPPLLSFYSYADIINNENPNPRRPSITQSLSSSFLRSNSMSSGSNMASQRTPQHAGIKFNQSPFGRNPSISRVPPMTTTKFHLDTSPNSSDSESDYVSSKTSAKKERTPSRRSIHRTQSNISTHSNFSRNTGISSSFVPEDDEEDEFVVSSIGDRIRSNTGEIRSRHSSIIA